jgi:hypothetical protein
MYGRPPSSQNKVFLNGWSCPYGLTNAPTNFMRMMENILQPLTDTFVVVYLNDILIYNKTWAEHLQHIQQVLHTLQQHKLYENLEKCSFGMDMVH